MLKLDTEQFYVKLIWRCPECEALECDHVESYIEGGQPICKKHIPDMEVPMVLDFVSVDNREELVDAESK